MHISRLKQWKPRPQNLTLNPSQLQQNSNDSDDTDDDENNMENNETNNSNNQNISIIKNNQWRTILCIIFMLLFNPIIGQKPSFKKMPFIIWEPMETYIFDNSQPQKLTINMENTCNNMVHHSHENLLNFCNQKRNEMMTELQTFCSRTSKTHFMTQESCTLFNWWNRSGRCIIIQFSSQTMQLTKIRNILKQHYMK